jgi:biopolymer transport protein ExbD
MARKMPEIPSASLADIAFLLLIFFLVTTTMDVDSGLERRLPPWVNPEDIDENTPPIKERNVFVVLVDRNNRLMVEGELCRVEDLREKAKEFLTNPRSLENLPEKETKTFDVVGNMEVITKSAVISLRNDVGTAYGTYIQVQNELVAAVNELRESLASDKFNKKYKDLTEDEQKIVQDVYPQKISEAEPKKIGGL